MINSFRNFYFLFHFLLCTTLLVSQSQHLIDSLRQRLSITTDDSLKFRLYNKLAFEYKKSDLDSAKKMADLQYGIALKSKKPRAIAASLSTLGTIYLNNDNGKALDYFNQALVKYRGLKDPAGEAQSLSNIGGVYTYTGDYNKAIQYTVQALKIKEKLGDKGDISSSYTNLLALNAHLGNYREGIRYGLKSLQLRKEINDEKGMSTCYGNIGSCYYNLGIIDSSIYFGKKALEIRLNLGDVSGTALSYNNLAGDYSELGQPNKALEYVLKALELYEKTGDNDGMSMASNNAGDLYTEMKDYKKAIEYCNKGLEYAKLAGSKDDEKDCLSSMAEVYSRMKNYEKAFEYYKRYTALKDSIFNEESTKQISEIQTQFETEKKENEIILLNKDKLLKNEEIEDQRTVQNYLVVVISLIFVFSFFVVRAYRQKRKANVIITLQKEEVEKQKVLVEEKNHEVEEKNKEILDSIHYAKRIQRALLTSEGYISKHVSEFFILYKPKDIVSGDFYWALAVERSESADRSPASHKFFIATADCTGHGVPGAFMSMLGVSFLNEIVLERKITNPGLVLDVMREEIIRILNPEGSTEESKDGMDCVLCAYDFDKMELNFAAANNPLWLVRNKEIIEYKPDKMPVGKYNDNFDSFTKQIIQLQKGDTIYTFTDGYADQFGGPKGKKFKYKQLENILLENSHQPLNKQKELLDSAIESWKGNLEQVDDILIIGIKV